MTGERMGYFTVVPSVRPDIHAAPVAGDWISLKNYQRCSIVLNVGDTAANAPTLRLQQATNVAGTGAAPLLFSAVWRTGARLYFDPTTVVGTFLPGEAVMGAGGGSGVIHSIHADHFVVHTYNNVAYVAGEVITGAISGATANLAAAGFFIDEDILCRHVQSAAASTFAAPAVANKLYVVEIDASMLAVNNGYDCLMADISALAGACDLSVTYILSQPRYKNEPMETAIYD